MVDTAYDTAVRTRGFGSLAWGSLQDLFDQSTAFGRLALVHVLMMAGDTLITISLAGSLFFSVSPTEAKSKVLLYLLVTIAPFAVVSPVLGPLIDRSVGGRRWLVVGSALLRGVLCWSMSSHLTSLWFYPEAFGVLICSKFYSVTRGALVPEMARADQLRSRARGVSASGWPSAESPEGMGFSGFNAQLTLLGTGSGLLAGAVGAAVLKALGAPSVLGVAVVVFAGAVVAGLRLVTPGRVEASTGVAVSQRDRDVQKLNPVGDPEVFWGLSASALVRFAVGFASFLLAFGLRREHASLSWYGAALGVSAVGSLLGLGLVTRGRSRFRESTLLVTALAVIATTAGICAKAPTNSSQVIMAGVVGLSASIAQPSFDALTQRLVPAGAQGRMFARFAVRQQLTWVIGAVLPVAISLSFRAGDQFLAVVMLLGTLAYAARGRGASAR